MGAFKTNVHDGIIKSIAYSIMMLIRYDPICVLEHGTQNSPKLSPFGQWRKNNLIALTYKIIYIICVSSL